MSVRFVEPMAAALVDALPTGEEWLYEAKFDGYRAAGAEGWRQGEDSVAEGETTSPPLTRQFDMLSKR